MAVTLRPLTRGDGFSRVCTYKENGVAASLADVAVRAHVRDSAGALLSELVVTKADQETSPGVFTLAPDPNPPEWPVDLLSIDIEFTPGGGTPRSTELIRLPVVADVTM